MTVELQGVDRASLVALLRDAAADIMGAHARADATHELADALQKLIPTAFRSDSLAISLSMLS
jgi:hypothetical protein